MDDVIGALAGLAAPATLSSLVASSGSIPMSDRAKMLVRSGGVLGTIGGGCLEAEILAVAGDVLADGVARTTDYTMTEKQAGEHGLNCGGTVRIYTERFDAAHRPLFAAIVTARRERRTCAMVTVLDTDQRAVFDAAGACTAGALPPALAASAPAWIAAALAAEEPGLVEAGAAQLFVEPYAPPPLLYVFGGGHVGGRVAALAKEVGFHTVVVDDRPYFANASRHPTVDACVVDDMDGVCQRLPIDAQTYIVAATRGHQHDEVVVEQAIRTPARYVGMLGSERKKLVLWQRIQARGGDRTRLDGVYAPIGLNIGADTPEEIAVSVVAELIAVRRGRRKVRRTPRPTSGGEPR